MSVLTKKKPTLIFESAPVPLILKFCLYLKKLNTILIFKKRRHKKPKPLLLPTYLLKYIQDKEFNFLLTFKTTQNPSLPKDTMKIGTPDQKLSKYTPPYNN